MADCGGFGSIDFLVKASGLSDPSLRLVIGLFSAYPLAFIYHAFFYRTKPVLQHMYFTFCGFSLAFFCYGWCAGHSMITIVSSYLLLHIVGPSSTMVALMFLFNMGYLLSGYVYYASGDYDVNWTTPQCILCLRLLSIAWDYYDGNQDQDKLSADFKTTAIATPPKLLEILGLSYFYGGFLVGPQFQMKAYLAFVNGTLIDKKDDDNQRLAEGLKRMSLGILYLGLYAVTEPWFSANVLLSDEYQRFSFLGRVWFMIFFSRVAFMKYLAVWLLSEGSCIISGISYNGKTEDGKVKWDGLRNIKLSVYETMYTFQHCVDAFNINTNKWVFRYIFKRLRFLEFIIMLMEKQVQTMCYAVTKKSLPEMPAYVKIPVILTYAFVVHFGLSYFMVAFNLLTIPRFHRIWRSIYYTVPVILVIWHSLYPIVIYPVFKKMTQDQKDRSKKEK
ncbi:Lysophosphatidylcholine acyltransferase 3 [Desmophyllum pertusum]|uniref:Lysophospholipid acyltransferase 5 n=1 Tax=Desmophyllum pertusum TaxID=174260 RepID=A0A9X0D0H2_9CNID|nr:Lysophosphatidylcholine acyltransferase 3 [Desmophyllum pertusum]